MEVWSCLGITGLGLHFSTVRSLRWTDIIGAAYADASVTVNSSAAYRKGEYYD